MSRNLYIATLEAQSGKSLVLLGLMELLSTRVEKVAVFRPVIPDPDQIDNDLELVRKRYKLKYPPEAMFGVGHAEARMLAGNGDFEELLKRIYKKYKTLEGQCDFVICEGTDLTSVSSAFELDFNLRVANELGCPILLLTSGRNRTLDEIVGVLRTGRELLNSEGCDLAAIFVNRVAPEAAAELTQQLRTGVAGSVPVYVLPEDRTLCMPTVGEVSKALDCKQLRGADDGMHREVLECKVAAMQLHHFLDHVEDGSLIITPGDRSDVILGSLATVYSKNYPRIAGMLLTGDLDPEPGVMRLIDGFERSPVPIFTTTMDTYTTVRKIESMRAMIRPDNERKIARALGLFESSVDLAELEQRISFARSARVTPIMFEYELVERAKAKKQHIVLPEGTDERILQAAEILLRREVVDVTLLGDVQRVGELSTSLGLDLQAARIVDPAKSPWRQDYADTYFQLRQHKGVTREAARDAMLDVSYFGTMMVYKGEADGMVSGAAHTTGHTIRPAFEFIRTVPGSSIVSSVFFMCLADRVLVYGDCAIIPNPTPQQLADIAISAAATAEMFDIEPRIAMLSYSTGESGKGEDVDKVREATRIAQQRRPDLAIEGPIQYDAAIDPGVARKKMPDSQVAGRATIFIFPDLNTGNNTYKAVQRAAGAIAVGPVLQGLKKPVNDLSRGCTVPDIVNTVAITAIQAQAISGAS
jgi:phosphate acetyltransferase